MFAFSGVLEQFALFRRQFKQGPPCHAALDDCAARLKQLRPRDKKVGRSAQFDLPRATSNSAR